VYDYDFGSSSLQEHIPVLSLSGSSEIPPLESDSHTLDVGDRLRLYKAAFAKHTRGVYQRDPHMQPRGQRKSEAANGISHNRFFPFITARDILQGAIDRRDAGGEGQHLIETNALVTLQDQTKHVRAVQIFDGTKPELVRDVYDGKFTGSYILRG